MISPDSPFTPAHPATPELFTGREDLIEKIHQVARRCANKRHVEMVFVCGERGMGKSSLTRNALRGLGDEFIGAEVNLGGVKTMEDAFFLTWRALLEKNHKQKQIADFFSKVNMKVRLNIVGAVEIEFDKKSRDFKYLLQEGNFASVLATLAKTNNKSTKGIVIVWDDINGLAELPEFAHWLKRFVESNVDAPALLIVAGVEERRRKIIGINPSANRIFSEILDVEPWSDEETEEFLRKGLKQGGFSPKLIPKNTYAFLSKACKGVPVFAQEVGDSIWQTHTKLQKSSDENEKSFLLFDAFDEAAKSIGRKRLEKDIVSALGSEDYIRLLGVLGNVSKGGEFLRKDLISNLPKEVTQSQAVGFLKRMRELGALELLPNVRGMYRFPNFLYYVYLCYFSPAVQKRREK